MAKFKINNQTIAIANTHLFWNPTYPDVKYEQIKYFIEQIELFNKENFPVLLGRDLRPKEVSRKHRFLFESCYGNYCQGEEPKNREPEYTNYQKEFNGTLDYIFYDKTQLRHISLLKVPFYTKIEYLYKASKT